MPHFQQPNPIRYWPTLLYVLVALRSRYQSTVLEKFQAAWIPYLLRTVQPFWRYKDLKFGLASFALLRAKRAIPLPHPLHTHTWYIVWISVMHHGSALVCNSLALIVCWEVPLRRKSRSEKPKIHSLQSEADKKRELKLKISITLNELTIHFSLILYADIRRHVIMTSVSIRKHKKTNKNSSTDAAWQTYYFH